MQVVLQESSRPSTSDLQYRDPQGQYSTDKPFWATISDARYVPGGAGERGAGEGRGRRGISSQMHQVVSSAGVAALSC